ncbi:MAG: prepilin-type N-terminal cleavage/methylation domain-containing protein [Opitutus sp.]
MNSSFPPHPPARGKFGVGRFDQRAFTILEVMIATFVMSLVIGTSLIAMQTGFRYVDVARGDTLASQIMQSEIERLRLMAWSKTSPAGVVDSITELPASETNVDLSTMFSSNAALASKFTLTRTVAVDGARADVRYITVTVRWSSSDRKSHTRSFTTMYAKNGLYDYYYTLANT